MSTLTTSQVSSDAPLPLDLIFKTIPRVLLCLLPWMFIIGPSPTDVVVSTLAVLWIAKSIHSRDWQWLSTPWIKVALILWGYLVVTNLIFHGVDKSTQLSLVWGRFIIFAAALEAWFVDEAWWRRLLLWSLAAVIIFVAFDAFYQYCTAYDVFGRYRTSDNRLTGPFRQPKVGIFLVKLSLPILLFAVVWLREHLPKGGVVLGALLWCAFAALIFLSGERMAFLLLGLGSGLIILFWPTYRYFFLIINLTMGGLLLLLVMYMPVMHDRFFNHTQREFSQPLQSPYQSIMMSAFRMVQDDPLFGIGLGNFRKDCPNPRYGPDDGRYPRCATHPHNYYVEWFVETGVLGLLGFFSFIGIWGYHSTRSLRKIRNDPIFMGVTITLLLQFWPIGATGSFFNNWNSALFWLILGIYGLLSKINTK